MRERFGKSHGVRARLFEPLSTVTLSGTPWPKLTRSFWKPSPLSHGCSHKNDLLGRGDPPDRFSSYALRLPYFARG